MSRSLPVQVALAFGLCCLLLLEVYEVVPASPQAQLFHAFFAGVLVQRVAGRLEA